MPDRKKTIAKLKASVAKAKADPKIGAAKKRVAASRKTQAARSKRKILEHTIGARKRLKAHKKAEEIKKLHKPKRSSTGKRWGQIIA